MSREEDDTREVPHPVDPKVAILTILTNYFRNRRREAMSVRDSICVEFGKKYWMQADGAAAVSLSNGLARYATTMREIERLTVLLQSMGVDMTLIPE